MMLLFRLRYASGYSHDLHSFWLWVITGYGTLYGGCPVKYLENDRVHRVGFAWRGKYAPIQVYLAPWVVIPMQASEPSEGLIKKGPGVN